MSCETRSTARDRVRRLARFWGVHAAGRPVCRGHHAPLDFLASWCLDRPALSLVHGPRGGGKSFLRAFATHLDSLRQDGHATRILGGSLAQSRQIYEALREFDRVRPEAKIFAPRGLTEHRATYCTGSDVAILAASPTSVRGPHVPTLCLDEVDEIAPDIREAAFGMCMARGGSPASVAMTSTWHRLGGPMEGLLERGRSGEFPVWTFCAFEVLESCPEDRSGPNLERCPECPLMRWCHDDKHMHGGLPKAKRSAGHYAIDSLIQKVRGVSLRVFESDYLCLGPKADGLWFKGFDLARHVSESAEFDPSHPAYLAVDPGVWTGAVFFQVRRLPDSTRLVTVFADLLVEDAPAREVAETLNRLAESRCLGRLAGRYSDPAGGARNPIGETVLDVYRRHGLPLDPWDRANPPVSDSLALVEDHLNPADGVPRLLVHPRCAPTIRAFLSYRRARRQGQWLDRPEDPQHPHEDLIDALRGGLHARLRRAVDRLFL
jgi:hypothetical protein